MPGPHFNSKRLKAAKNVRAEFAPGSVPRVGTRLFTFRLLPRTVESNCGCHVRQPITPAAPAAPALPSYVCLGALINNNEIIDPLDPNGTSTTHTSFIETKNINENLPSGSTTLVYFTKPGTNTIFASHIDTVHKVGNVANGRRYKITITTSHNIATLTNAQINIGMNVMHNKTELKNNNQLSDQNNLNNNGTDTVFETYKIKVGDVVIHQDANYTNWIAATVSVLEKNANGEILSIRITPNHGIMAAAQWHSIYFRDNR